MWECRLHAFRLCVGRGGKPIVILAPPTPHTHAPAGSATRLHQHPYLDASPAPVGEHEVAGGCRTPHTSILECPTPFTRHPSVSMTFPGQSQTSASPEVIEVPSNGLLCLQVATARTRVWTVPCCTWTNILTTAIRHGVLFVPGGNDHITVLSEPSNQGGVGILMGQGQPVIDRVEVAVVVLTGKLARILHGLVPHSRRGTSTHGLGDRKDEYGLVLWPGASMGIRPCCMGIRPPT